MPRPTTAARRVAEAAFELAGRDGTLDAWLIGLEAAAAALGDDRVRRFIDNPRIPFEERRNLLRALLSTEAILDFAGRLEGAGSGGQRLGALRQSLTTRVGSQLVNLCELLLTRGRVGLLPAVSAQYRALLNARRGVVAATVTSALPLEPSETEAIQARLEELRGAQVDLRVEHDPSLIGGVRVRVGDTLIDASVRGRLERLRERLASAAP